MSEKQKPGQSKTTRHRQAINSDSSSGWGIVDLFIFPLLVYLLLETDEHWKDSSQRTEIQAGDSSPPPAWAPFTRLQPTRYRLPFTHSVKWVKQKSFSLVWSIIGIRCWIILIQNFQKAVLMNRFCPFVQTQRCVLDCFTSKGPKVSQVVHASQSPDHVATSFLPAIELKFAWIFLLSGFVVRRMSLLFWLDDLFPLSSSSSS